MRITDIVEKVRDEFEKLAGVVKAPPSRNDITEFNNLHDELIRAVQRGKTNIDGESFVAVDYCFHLSAPDFAALQKDGLEKVRIQRLVRRLGQYVLDKKLNTNGKKLSVRFEPDTSIAAGHLRVEWRFTEFDPRKATRHNVGATRAELLVRDGPNAGQRFEINQPHTTLGREDPDKRTDIELTHAGANRAVGRGHAVIDLTPSGFTITETNGENGTWVDGHKLVPGEPYSLRNSSEIVLAKAIHIDFHIIN